MPINVSIYRYTYFSSFCQLFSPSVFVIEDCGTRRLRNSPRRFIDPNLAEPRARRRDNSKRYSPLRLPYLDIALLRQLDLVHRRRAADVPLGAGGRQS